MEKKLSSEVIEQIKEKRRSQLLHGEVEAKLIAMLERVIPQYYPVKEPQGLAGGRNDLMLFEFSGRKILFEVLATASQVSRDLRILDKTKADVKIAVIIDPEIDNRVIERFLKENPENNYPYIFIGELFEQSLMHQAAFKMLELITGNEEAKFNRMLRQRVSTNFLEMCKKEGLQILFSEDLESGSITFQKLFLTVIAKRLMDLGANWEQLKGLLHWMSDEEMLKFILMKINLGFNMFLYTDLNETKAIYSDNEPGFSDTGFQQAFICISSQCLMKALHLQWVRAYTSRMVEGRVRLRRVTPTPPAVPWLPGDRPCQSPR